MGKDDGANGKSSKTGPKGAASSRYKGTVGTRSAEPVEWAQVSSDCIRSAIDACITAGDAIIFGRSRDGGALSVTVLSGEHRFRYWAATLEEAEAVLRSVKDDADAVTFDA